MRQSLEVRKPEIIDDYVRAYREGPAAVSRVSVELQEENTYRQALQTFVLGLLEFGKVTAANELDTDVPTTPRRDQELITTETNLAVDEQEARMRLRLQAVTLNALENDIPENELELQLEQEYDAFVDQFLPGTVGAMFPKSLNRGRGITFSANNDQIFAFRYTAVLDSRTTDYCRELDGEVFQATDPNFAKVTPPNHFNCRSVWTAVTNDEAETTDIQVTGKPEDLPTFATVSSFRDVTDEAELSEEEKKTKVLLKQLESIQIDA